MVELVVVGDAVTDIVVRLTGPPEPGSDAPAEIAIRPGGQGAATSAWLAQTGANVHLVACVGADETGDRLESTLASAGVCTHLQRDVDAPTGSIVVLVDEHGERTMLTDRAANRRLSTVPAEVLSEADHLHLSGYVLLDPASRDVGRAVLAQARQAGLTVSVSTSSRAPLAAAGPASFLSWSSGADLCLASAAEAEVLTGHAQPALAVRRLLEHYGAATVTAGADGAWFASPEHELHGPALDGAVLDTTGAGDAFAAGFLAEWRAGRPARAALGHGLELARLAVSRIGSWPGGR